MVIADQLNVRTLAITMISFLLLSLTITYLGSYHFLPGGGGRLSVIAGRHFFLVPPLGLRLKILVPPLCLRQKNLVPPFGLVKKFWSPPPKVKEHSARINK